MKKRLFLPLFVAFMTLFGSVWAMNNENEQNKAGSDKQKLTNEHLWMSLLEYYNNNKQLSSSQFKELKDNYGWSHLALQAKESNKGMRLYQFTQLANKVYKAGKATQQQDETMRDLCNRIWPFIEALIKPQVIKEEKPGKSLSLTPDYAPLPQSPLQKTKTVFVSDERNKRIAFQVEDNREKTTKDKERKENFLENWKKIQDLMQEKNEEKSSPLRFESSEKMSLEEIKNKKEALNKISSEKYQNKEKDVFDDFDPFA